MSVSVTITDGPLPHGSTGAELHDGSACTSGSTGAVLVFDGIVRRREGDRDIAALVYEVYEPMASRMLQRIAEEVVSRHALLSLAVEHSRGVVPVGRASLRVRIASAHRAEALVAMGEFINLLKRDVPIWKKASS